MPCNHIMPDQDIADIYSAKGVKNLQFLDDNPCQNEIVKERNYQLINTKNQYMTLTPIQRKYHIKAPLWAFSGSGKVVEHKLFILHPDYRKKGYAKAFSENEEIIYRNNNFNEVQIEAAWDGVNVWRKLKYEYLDKKVSKRIFLVWRAYFSQTWTGQDKSVILRKYKSIDEVPTKYLAPDNLASMGDWIANTKAIPLLKMYKKVS